MVSLCGKTSDVVVVPNGTVGVVVFVCMVDKVVVVMVEVVVVFSTNTDELESAGVIVGDIVEFVIALAVGSVIADGVTVFDEAVVIVLETGVLFVVVLLSRGFFIKPTAKPIESSKRPTTTAVTVLHRRL